MKIQSRITVFVAIGSIFALMGGLFVYVDNTPSLQKAQIELYEVELLSVNTEENSAELSVSFIHKSLRYHISVPRITYLR